jgi:hypothetical protein
MPVEVAETALFILFFGVAAGAWITWRRRRRS